MAQQRLCQKRALSCDCQNPRHCIYGAALTHSLLEFCACFEQLRSAISNRHDWLPIFPHYECVHNKLYACALSIPAWTCRVHSWVCQLNVRPDPIYDNKKSYWDTHRLYSALDLARYKLLCDRVRWTYLAFRQILHHSLSDGSCSNKLWKCAQCKLRQCGHCTCLLLPVFSAYYAFWWLIRQFVDTPNLHPLDEMDFASQLLLPSSCWDLVHWYTRCMGYWVSWI